MTDDPSFEPEVAERSSHRLSDIFSGYHPLNGFYDEIYDEQSNLRPHWNGFVKGVNAIGTREFARRWEQARRLLHENGITYSILSEPRGKPRPWELDPIPLLIPEIEWTGVTKGLEQRATLLNLILADLYGPQTLLTEGHLPAKLLYRHPGFCRQFHGQANSQTPRRRKTDIPLGGNGPDATTRHYLHFYAADLSRSPDGRWWIVGDRTEAPSGAGFALENRIVQSRMLPRMFRDLRIKRLAPYFMALRDTLQKSSWHHRENPLIILLTQGPHTANYFEDAYLARYLGYTLAEAGDLTVRNDIVMMKTLGGLLPVDVLLRRLNSESCDPLELSSESPDGIAGLLQCIRSNSSLVANSLGSGLIESPVFMYFLPQLCQTLLGEDLALPGVATWWCGQPRSLDYVLGNLNRLIIRPAFRRRGAEMEQLARLSQMDPGQLADHIRSDPDMFVAQERVARSTIAVHNDRVLSMDPSTLTNAPNDTSLQSTHVMVRAFAVATSDGFNVMQGGLGRVADPSSPLFASLLEGERSKDVWVLSETPVLPTSLLPTPSQPLELRRIGTELPSRVADHIFWLGRYLERTDASARLIRTLADRITSETYSPDMVEIPVLLRMLAEQGQIEPGYALAELRDQMPAIEQILPPIAFDEAMPTSLRSMVNHLFRTASIVRDRLSVDSWRTIRHVVGGFRKPDTNQPDLLDLISRIDDMILELAAFNGMVMESMTRTHTWRFLDIGRRLERSIQTIRLINHTLGSSVGTQGPVLETALEIADSHMTYRSRYLANLQWAPVLDLLLTDETNPRSVAFQFVLLADHVNMLPRDESQTVFANEQRLAMNLINAVRLLDVKHLAVKSNLGENNQLQHHLSNLQNQIPKMSNAISHKYLVHTGQVHQLSHVGNTTLNDPSHS